jgi:hypothetical protein
MMASQTLLRINLLLAISTSDNVDRFTDSASTLPKANDRSAQEAWFDVGEDCYVYEDIRPIPILKHYFFGPQEPDPLDELNVLDLTEYDNISVEEEMPWASEELSAAVLGSLTLSIVKAMS